IYPAKRPRARPSRRPLRSPATRIGRPTRSGRRSRMTRRQRRRRAIRSRSPSRIRRASRDRAVRTWCNPRMATITTRDGVSLYVKDWGRGRPVVLLHGWPLSADTFDDLGMALADAGMRAIAYDRRGFGRSDQPWGGYDYDTLATD